jgi:hypothetical protein
MDYASESYDFDAYDSYDTYDYADRGPWRGRPAGRRPGTPIGITRPPVTPSPGPGPAAARGDFATRTELNAAVANVTREIAAANEAVNKRISDTLSNVKKEAVGSKRAIRNTQMMALFPLLLTKQQNLQFTATTVGDQKVITEVKDTSSDNDTMLLVVMMMMMIGSGGTSEKEGGDDNTMMMMLMMVLLLGQQKKTDTTVVTKSN